MTEFVWREERTDHAIRDALDRRHPERLQLRPNDVRGVREGFDLVDQIWAPTIERASRLPRPLLHERVNGEYSFVETLRHLLFAWDSWLTRMVLRVPNAYHEWGVAPAARPEDVVDLEPVLSVRAERFGRVRDHLSRASDASLTTVVSPPDSTGHPQADHAVLYCFRIVLNEQWRHHQYASRDLRALERP